MGLPSDHTKETLHGGRGGGEEILPTLKGHCKCKLRASGGTGRVDGGKGLRVCPPQGLWPPHLSMETWPPLERCQRQELLWKKSGLWPDGEGAIWTPRESLGRVGWGGGPLGYGVLVLAPAFEQQDPEQLLSVLRPDLLLVDKPVQQLAGHPGQGGLRQVQEDSA